MDEELLRAKEEIPLDETNEGYYPGLFFILRQQFKVELKPAVKMVINEAKGTAQIDYSKIVNLFDIPENTQAPPQATETLVKLRSYLSEVAKLPQPKSPIMNLVWVESLCYNFNGKEEFQQRCRKLINKIIDPIDKPLKEKK